ncbi:MAG: asparagine synthase-related protein [Flavobacteriaceae bacterium]|nr:asparagine synthase-related protein [Flavobacteriaceae bacterium]
MKTQIIPIKPTFAKVQKNHSQSDLRRKLNKESICIFTAIGFFLDQDTYWKDEVVLPAASENKLDKNGILQESKPYFKWHYSPRNITFEQALEEFTELFHTIIEEQVGNKKVILPLSGGLDSRTQAVALKALGKEVHSYSYDFKEGYPETNIAKQIAKVCGFEFQEFHIGKGYLWNSIEELATINNCYSDFTHPRQMAIINEFDAMGDVFSLGHWGDVLFDKMVDRQLSSEEELQVIIKKIIVKGGMELATALWKQWGLEGNFENYLHHRIKNLLDKIEIKNSSAKIRAFKSMYWAPRWTSVNLAVFSEKKPITLPYYDDRMCEFICTVPEKYLADRKLQIAYIKQQNPEVAKITWQSEKPFNLYTFQKNKSPYNLPYRVLNKLQRETKAILGKPYIQRNWELQFLGDENKKQLERYLFSDELKELVSEEIVQDFYRKFETQDQVQYSHPVSMLLTLALKMKQMN